MVGEEDLINNEKSVGQRNAVIYKKYDVKIISNYNIIVCITYVYVCVHRRTN